MDWRPEPLGGSNIEDPRSEISKEIEMSKVLFLKTSPSGNHEKCFPMLFMEQHLRSV